jgi:hypothetical protein
MSQLCLTCATPYTPTFVVDGIVVDILCPACDPAPLMPSSPAIAYEWDWTEGGKYDEDFSLELES